jgi:hypothetical protein
MAQTGYTPIQLYRTTTSGAAPDAANLNPGELAININDADMALYAENQSGTVKRLMNNPAGLKYPTADGTPNQILKTDGSGNLTFVTPASPGTGTVTSVGGTGTVNGITLTGTVTSSGNLTLGGALSGVSLTTQVSGTLPVLNGGTGVTSSTGSGNVVLSSSPSLSSPTFSSPVLGTPSSGTLSSCTVDGTNAVGYKNIPQTGSDKTTAYTLVTGDVGKYVGVGTSGSIVVPTSTFANGDAISIYNNTTGNITITTSAPTAYIAGTNTVKTSMTLATRGVATIMFVSATVCVVTGNVS